MTRTRWIALAAVSVGVVAAAILSVALLPAGTARAPAPAPSTGAVTPTPPATAILLATGEWSPYTSQAMEGNGAFTEIVSTVFQEMGRTPHYLFLPWKRAESETLDGRVFAAFPYMITDARRQDFNFTDPICATTGKFFYIPARHPAGIAYQKLEDLRGYRIGAVLGHWYEDPLREAGLDIGLVVSDEQSFSQLHAGHVDLVPVDELVGWHIVDRLFPGEAQHFATLAKPLNDGSPLHLMVSRTYPDGAALTRQFNLALKTIRDNGTYARIMDHHGLR
jgi:polar amino acid transport system substrate-binding protein